MTKAEWRQKAKSAFSDWRRNLSEDSFLAVQESIAAHLTSFIARRSGCWTSFLSLSGEPNLSSLHAKFEMNRWIFPRVVGSELEFVEPTSTDSWSKSTLGVLEAPLSQPAVTLKTVTGLLVPGLAFDRRGERLGRGKGYYDRALAQTNATKVGVTFSCLLFEDELPAEPHDQKVDFVATEDGVWPCQTSVAIKQESRMKS